MQRREFVSVAGALVLAATQGRKDGRGWRRRSVLPSFRPSIVSQEPALSPEVFSRRLARAQAELKTRKWDFLIATPGTTYLYFTGYNPGRSERLIALVLPRAARPRSCARRSKWTASSAIRGARDHGVGGTSES